jgi:hypothetical protein
VDNQHKKISGYRDLDQTEIDAMNKVKELGLAVKALVDHLNEMDTDKRWLNIGTTDLQKGFMALTRSVAKPGGF